MKVALGQFAVDREWQQNATTITKFMSAAQQNGADLLVLPEGVLARDITNPNMVLTAAQPLDGPFISHLLEASKGSNLTTMLCVHIPNGEGKVWNTLLALCNGEIVAQYRKLHLYDAFSVQESENVLAGEDVPPLLTIAGLNVGLMTCYDIRFPELARRLVLDGADVLVLPSAWIKGPLKEAHWELLVRARALENTAYLVAVGECGVKNIGNSMVVDPLGVVVVQAPETPALIYADIDPERLAYARQILPVLANRRFQKPTLDGEN
ncbi:deaminated glutathione amidase [Pectobacterium brasiliense]|uniref:deaminated glutathione amidase n=1 Tax=Pectobacterium brasiliense TaxID=180957 RepID=UPI000C1BE4E4|nr:deaminated glutathione amidase [Pectobacterium brasiliense]ATV43965.1 hydrolase [Pectobacterium brasiliense]MBA0208353.1 deaminated glutathione amidase [Pectobacterium brasiliense]MCA6981636.1 deaminated glutathione amidase [Pectobacterium brasiliense]MCH4991193.1 deaminated glutathione amidase [Pectobacterium brasiliense]QSD37386.1 deaminated glutathione amidase [Pectobacterium brasiliense]